MKEKLESLKNIKSDFLEIFLLLSLSAAGLFNEYLCCFASVVLCGYLFYLIKKSKKTFFYINLSSIAVLLVSVFYFFSALWAVDSGAAFIGALKFLPLTLIMCIAMQKEEDSEKYLSVLPYFAAFMTVISAILSFFESTEHLVEIAGRLCGFFQYSNTFALFLLISLIICTTKGKLNKSDFAIIPILLFGIIYSGSRTVFILLIVSIIGILFLQKNKKMKIAVCLAAVAVIGIAVIVALITDNFYSIGRFLTVSFKESTFVGRLLYYTDALPVILKHPFGLGYMGYYYLQSGVQTGVYSVMNVHNDFLQLFLDIGWIAPILLIAAIVKTFFSKTSSGRKRLLLLIICAHSCFDFDLQYLSMFMILILLLDFREGEQREVSISKGIKSALVAVVCCVSLYVGISQAFSYFQMKNISVILYPWSTADKIAMLTSTDNAEEMDSIADEIISSNEYVSLAYSAKARVAFARGDIFNMISYKEKAIENAVLSYDEYLDYCQMLVHAISLYQESGDIDSMKYCAEKLIQLENKLNENENRLSYFGKLINKQPETQFPDDIHNYIDELKSAIAE